MAKYPWTEKCPKGGRGGSSRHFVLRAQSPEEIAYEKLHPFGRQLRVGTDLNYGYCGECGQVFPDYKFCDDAVHDSFGVSFHACEKRATTGPYNTDCYGRVIEGKEFFFCSVHSPEAKKARHAKFNAKYTAELEAQRKKINRDADQRERLKQLDEIIPDILTFFEVNSDLTETDELAKKIVRTIEGLKRK